MVLFLRPSRMQVTFGHVQIDDPLTRAALWRPVIQNRQQKWMRALPVPDDRYKLEFLFVDRVHKLLFGSSRFGAVAVATNV